MTFLDTAFLRDGEIQLRLLRTVDGCPERQWVPAYHFAICAADGTPMGACDLRVGHNEQLYYGGNIGYRIDPLYRGHHYAAKACQLLFELARRHGLRYVLITCTPDNGPSRRTCELAGGRLLAVALLPADSDMRLRGETEKCIYRFDL